MPLRRTIYLVSTLMIGLVARADTFSFQIAGPSDTGMGTLTAQGTGTAGTFLVTSIAGQLDGLTITSLVPAGVYPPDAPNDNAFFFPAAADTTYFDACGVSFELSDGTDVNLYFGTYSSMAGALGLSYILVQGVDETASALTSLSVSPTVSAATATPEPSTFALLSSGLAVLHGLRRRRLRSGATSATPV